MVTVVSWGRLARAEHAAAPLGDRLQVGAALRAATRVSFDRLDSDGCMSTNDTVARSGTAVVRPYSEPTASVQPGDAVSGAIAMTIEALLLHVAVRRALGIVVFAFADPHALTPRTEAVRP